MIMLWSIGDRDTCTTKLKRHIEITTDSRWDTAHWLRWQGVYRSKMIVGTSLTSGLQGTLHVTSCVAAYCFTQRPRILGACSGSFNRNKTTHLRFEFFHEKGLGNIMKLYGALLDNFEFCRVETTVNASLVKVRRWNRDQFAVSWKVLGVYV